MQNEEKSEETPAKNPSETKENLVAKLVLLVVNPDGTSFAKSFTRLGIVPTEVTLNGTTMVTLKEFEILPKKISFLFEKSFSKLN